MEQKCENNTECKTIKYRERSTTEVIRGRLTSFCFCSPDRETNNSGQDLPCELSLDIAYLWLHILFLLALSAA